jgi:hypothetical protein
MEIVRCVSCDGYGWTTDDEIDGCAALDEAQTCAWCGGVGYVYRDSDGIDRRIPAADLDARAADLEALERERLRELGYTGDAVHPSEQAIRRRAE